MIPDLRLDPIHAVYQIGPSIIGICRNKNSGGQQDENGQWQEMDQPGSIMGKGSFSRQFFMETSSPEQDAAQRKHPDAPSGLPMTQQPECDQKGGPQRKREEGPSQLNLQQIKNGSDQADPEPGGRETTSRTKDCISTDAIDLPPKENLDGTLPFRPRHPPEYCQPDQNGQGKKDCCSLFIPKNDPQKDTQGDGDQRDCTDMHRQVNGSQKRGAQTAGHNEKNKALHQNVHPPALFHTIASKASSRR